MRLEFSHCYFGLSITTRATRNTITKRASKQREPRDQATHVVLTFILIPNLNIVILTVQSAVWLQLRSHEGS